MNEKKPLYIPQPTPDNDDVITGFGIKELTIIGIGIVTGIILAVMLYKAAGDIVTAILVPFAGVALLIVCIRRDQYSESLIDKLMFVWKYYKSQKRFMYEYYDFIGHGIAELEKEGK